jgi:hypothetical protein
MSLNHHLMLLLSSLLFCHFKSFDFKQHFAIGLIIVFKSIMDCLHLVVTLLVKATDYLVTLYLVIHFVREVAMKLTEFIGLPL